MPFSKLGLSDAIVKAVTDMGYTTPTPIQEKAIPVALTGKNLLAAAQTGTGKTASFVLPILQMLDDGQQVRAKRVRALILAPTRELAVQVEANIAQYSKHTNLTSMAMYGGVDYEPQKRRLIEGVDILVATPGRLLDMYTKRAIHFDAIEILVLDEADRMLDMGFIEDINKIIERLPLDRQNMLFSATLSAQVRLLAKTAVRNPVEISVAKDEASQPKIDQCLITVDKDMKSSLLSHLINEQQWDQALIFIETKHGAAKLVSQLEKRGIAAEAIHSGRSQGARAQVLEDFKAGKVKYLIATGVAARGLDIDELTRVVNYDLPFPPEEYVHRIGRTGRAGSKGEAISFVSRDNFKNLCMIERLLGHLIVRKEIEGFVPTKEVPISILNFKPKYNKPEDKNSTDGKPRRNDKPRSNTPSTDKPKAKKPRNRKPITDRDTGIPRGTRKPKSA
ncbi:DEAD/DEAH box helicase [Photobacterium kishitanii]|uniref:DEAD/DEAH box helicase n=1 Tax=Photobacterium kishitanii TaxID=318456 RepID=UPI00043167CC|nr:DEAD/DEAH box helicase [Photobacterium kishitanii]PSU88897.1 ATP-dependent helicase [Photobacterium kishitanii]PSV18173.1 ATP-dependent helicase [Photobacterium kishitanii]PSV19263.1 ATP-dependent helicase [Photobacterium kishitanii]PSW63680.1 ATP-dependent helicase [Photobacterium kishitanii]CEO39447.1 ATP-dependent RNA helicase RhlE [Photobacterium kishitanii]